MTARRSRFLAVLLPAVGVAILANCAPRSDAQTDTATARVTASAPADTARVERVLRGLRPSVEVVGRPPVQWSVAERMANYKVPGVSIAVIEGGRVSWARGVGVKE